MNIVTEVLALMLVVCPASGKGTCTVEEVALPPFAKTELCLSRARAGKALSQESGMSRHYYCIDKTVVQAS